MKNMTVREAFATFEAEKDISAGKVKELDGIKETKLKLWRQHNRDKIDDICVEYAEKGGYAAWQNDRYPVRVDFPKWVKRTRTFDKELSFKDTFSSPGCIFRKVDTNYNRSTNSQ